MDFILEAQLLEPLAGCIVVMSCSLGGEGEGLLLYPIGQIRNLGRHAGKGRRIAFSLGAQVALEPFQRIGDCCRRTPAMRFAHLLDGRTTTLFTYPSGNVNQSPAH